jgi:transcriptional regulator of acetoin/glycerol metabolism
VKGAFTGALKDKPGRFELAEDGTLFLNEIGKVPLTMQSKLLRVLQERELERVGDTHTGKVNVRVISASNRDLKKEVDEGRFRQDLFLVVTLRPFVKRTFAKTFVVSAPFATRPLARKVSLSRCVQRRTSHTKGRRRSLSRNHGCP